MTPEFVIPAVCPACQGPAEDHVWFDDGVGAPSKATVCPACPPSPAINAVAEFWDDPDDADYSDSDDWEVLTR